MKTQNVPKLPLCDLTNAEAAAEVLLEVAQSNHSIWVLTADVMHSTKTEPFALAYPERFINVGIAEQTMIGIAAGLATCGKIPFAASFAAMVSMRACEQIRTDVAYPNLNVKLFCTHSGFALGAGGTTHHATEDIAIMRSMANMTVIVPSDAKQAREATLAAIERQGPVYLRFGRGRDPVVYPNECDFRIGRANVVREGSDVTLIGCGRTVAECVVAAELLAAEGIQARVLDMHTIKPIDAVAIEEAIAGTRMVFTAEEHSVVGGLGGAVAEVMVELRSSVPLRRLGVPDIYAAIGPQEALLEKYGVTGPRIAETVLASL
ncbi:MAG: transketolase family protein [Chloroflexota bacterium]